MYIYTYIDTYVLSFRALSMRSARGVTVCCIRRYICLASILAKRPCVLISMYAIRRYIGNDLGNVGHCININDQANEGHCITSIYNNNTSMTQAMQAIVFISNYELSIRPCVHLPGLDPRKGSVRSCQQPKHAATTILARSFIFMHNILCYILHALLTLLYLAPTCITKLQVHLTSTCTVRRMHPLHAFSCYD